MTDYLPLISRAVEGLEKNTGENRRELYERARVALVHQLRGIEPPLDESEITRERLALEEAIRKIEAEAVRYMHSADEAAPPPEEARPSLRDQGLRDFRETVAEVEDLGGAAAEANRAAWEAYERIPDEHGAPARADSHEYAEHFFEPPPAEHKPAPREIRESIRVPHPAPMPREPRRASSRENWPSPAAPAEAETHALPLLRDYGRIIKVAIIVLLVFGVAGLGYSQRGRLSSMMAGLRGSKPPVTRQQAPQPAGTPKIADRVGPSSSDRLPSAANAPAAAVAQKVVLYEEDSTNPQGQRFVGSAIWRTETVSPGVGLAPELVVRADVEIPERHMRMIWSLRRNTDKALPASHTIEVTFMLPPDFAEGGIGNVPGVLMKPNEQTRGVPLAGLAVKVTNGYFLIGLSAVDLDVQRNVQLLKERDWFDVPVVYTSGKRAILAVEKGTPGARAFEEAFRAWGE